MSGTKLFTIFGATGNQGGSIINHILGHPKLSQEYKLRGVTRNTDSDKAKALTDRGVEMVSGDMENYDSVSKAVAGSYAVFGVTNYWENPPSKEREVNQGKRIADAAKEHGVKQFVWSNLPNVTRLSDGKYPNVLHFDGKAEIGDYVASLGVPYINVVPAMFMGNLHGSIQKDDNGDFTFAMPFESTVPMPFVNPANDLGSFVVGALLKPESFSATNPANISVSSGYVTGDEIVAAIKEITGKDCKYFQVPEDMFKGFMETPELGQEMLENMFLVRDYGYFGPTCEASVKGLEESIKEYSTAPLQTVKEYLAQAKL